MLVGCSDDDASAPTTGTTTPGSTTPATAAASTSVTPGTTAAGAPATTTTTAASATTAPAPEQRTAQPIAGPAFSLGVASGDPDDTSVVLWTRVHLGEVPGADTAPLTDDVIDVVWEVTTADDADFAAPVARGLAEAPAALGYSVHALATGLAADTRYLYRFRVVASNGEQTSDIGVTRTFPSPDASPDMLTFAFASCQDYQAGYYSAWRDVAQQAPDLDCVVFLGDYIYEGGVKDDAIRPHDSDTVRTLDEYRRRYALYKGDPDLQAAHRAAPWLVTWDDHEVANNYAADTVERADPDFLVRRAAGYQAWWEHMPTRIAPPDGPDLVIYREASFGDLASFYVLDGRQYRSVQPCRGSTVSDFGASCAAVDDPDATLLGREQEGWLLQGLTASSAVWDVLCNDVILSGFNFDPAPDKALYLLDTWDGYPVQRDRLIEALDRNLSPNRNFVVITGDVHAAFAMDTVTSEGTIVASEFVGAGISSAYPIGALTRNALSANAHVRFYDERKGYVLCRVTRDAWVADFRSTDALNRDSRVESTATFTITAGTPGAVKTS